ncbi:MAG: family 78 glycoside hydrolase catalytic domain [Lentisphaerota bacterium]
MLKNTAGLEAAEWIRDQRFSREQNVKNVHTFFRKNLEINGGEMVSAKLTFTADDYCKIYINGALAAIGPAPGHIDNYYFMSMDVKEMIQNGDNYIAVHCYYQGLMNRVWNSGDGLSGLKLLLSIKYHDGHEQEIATDHSWRCFDCQAYQSDITMGYETQYAENIDMRLMPADWKEIKFDDSGWNAPEALNNYPHQLKAQTTLPLCLKKIYPARTLNLKENCCLIDFGREVAGYTVVNASGASGHVMEIRHAEELNSDGSARYKLRANCEYQEFLTLSGRGKDKIDFFDYKAFRYIELINYPGFPACDDIFVIERHYPFDNAAELKTSDNTLDRIWDICSLAVKLGTQDSYLDCMTREKGAYLGDAYVTGLSHLYLTGKSEMLKKVLRDFAESAKYSPGLRAVWPGAFEQDIADYSLLWIPLLHEYYMWTGDADFIRELLPVTDGVMEYFRAYENSEGLLENFTGKPVMVDWPKNLRDDYDDPGLMGDNQAQKGINTLINIYYYGTIAAAQKIYTAAGNNEQAAENLKKADAISLMLKKRFLVVNGFTDSDSSKHISLHTNALALMFNMVTPDEAKLIIPVLKQKRIKCGVYFSFFLLKGLCNYGEAEFAYELMTCDDVHSWQTMLKDGATTCMEAWGLEQKWNTSLCHPWASAPIYMTAAEVFGLKPKTPGWSEINFNPEVPESVKYGSISINIPQGKVTVSFSRPDGEIKFDVKVPAKCRIIVNKAIAMNEQPCNKSN